MHVVATAGHVDHGKSTLVRALTGMEPDRWAEERRRGMTIDLGFAWTTLPSGSVLGFVDVPGHARFIGSMLAGLGPAPAVLVVVAADEGWCRQSGEHLAALDALGITAGLLAVTRSDLADPLPATAEAQEQLARSSLGAVEALAVSGATGAGIPDLAQALDRLLSGQPAPDVHAAVRLWVDRAFTVRGSGTVVTGTLTAGTLRTGDELLLRGRRVRVRGLQSLGAEHDEVRAVARVAVNLRGVERDQVARGDALLAPDAWHASATLDVRLTVDPRTLSTELVLHVGSAALPVHVRPLGRDTARLSLTRPVALRAGDRALLRDPGGQVVATGVLVLDVDPPELRRRGAAAERGRDLEKTGGVPDLTVEVARRGAVRESALAALGVPMNGAADVRREGEWLVDPGRWRGWQEQLVAAVDAHVAAHPLDVGLSTETARQVLALPDPRLLAPLMDAAGLLVEAGQVRRPGTARDLGPAESGVTRVERRLRSSPFDAPDRTELAGLGLGRPELAAAERAARLLRVDRDVVLLPDAPAQALRVLATLPQPFTLAAARSALGTTRRVALPLLEHLDGRGWTRRLDGGLREVRADR